MPSTRPTRGNRWSPRLARLFAAQGFDGTGTEQIVAEARVTRGALYHHFRDKADLFRAVMAQAAGDVATRLIDEQLAADAESPLAEIRDGVSAFLDVCVGGDFQRIVLVDGPRVLGADAWDDLVERYGREHPRGVAYPLRAGRRPGPGAGPRTGPAAHRDAHRGQPRHRRAPPTRPPSAPNSARSSTACSPACVRDSAVP